VLALEDPASLHLSRFIGRTETCMNQMCKLSGSQETRTTSHPIKLLDPLDRDEPGEALITVTRRSLVRLALVASEVGARFQREGISYDAMAWMQTERRIFDGETAMEACLRLDPCKRALLLHGLGLGLDASRADMDELLADNDDEDVSGLTGYEDGDGPEDGPRLFTALLVDETETGVTQAFEALVATDGEVVRDRIRSRHGDRVAGAADIREGFDGTEPLAEALISEAMSEMLRQVAADPTSSLAAGLEVAIAQRFAE
jgi:hypothetical protein